MNQILGQNRAQAVRLNLDRDHLLEWLLQNMKDDTIARVYVGSHYVMVGLDEEVKLGSEV